MKVTDQDVKFWDFNFLLIYFGPVYCIVRKHTFWNFTFDCIIISRAIIGPRVPIRGPIIICVGTIQYTAYLYGVWRWVPAAV